jgi:hypothetical protein
MGEVWYREKIKITVHYVIIKYLVHSIEWGVTPRTVCVCGTVWVINSVALVRKRTIPTERLYGLYNF